MRLKGKGEQMEMTEVDWTTLLVSADMNGLWNGLNTLVSRHLAVRPLREVGQDGVVSLPITGCADLTQELFLELLTKHRFEHYLDNSYSNAQIENEIAYVELPNLKALRLLDKARALCKCCVA